MLVHIIADEKGFQNLNASSKMNTEWEFLDHLHKLGYRAADDWLEVNFKRLGKSSSVNVRGLLHGCSRK
jgi:NTE family protein